VRRFPKTVRCVLKIFSNNFAKKSQFILNLWFSVWRILCSLYPTSPNPQPTCRRRIPGSKQGLDTVSKLWLDTGSKLRLYTGSKLGLNTGCKLGLVTGSKQGHDTVSKLWLDTGSKLGLVTGSKLGLVTGCKLGLVTQVVN